MPGWNEAGDSHSLRGNSGETPKLRSLAMLFPSGSHVPSLADDGDRNPHCSGRRGVTGANDGDSLTLTNLEHMGNAADVPRLNGEKKVTATKPRKDRRFWAGSVAPDYPDFVPVTSFPICPSVPERCPAGAESSRVASGGDPAVTSRLLPSLAAGRRRTWKYRHRRSRRRSAGPAPKASSTSPCGDLGRTGSC